MIKHYVHEYKKFYFLSLVLIGIVHLLLFLGNLDLTIMDIYYLDSLIAFILFAFSVVDYMMFRKKWLHYYKNICKNEVNEGYLHGHDFYSALLKKTIAIQHKNHLASYNKCQEASEDVRMYLTRWVHEVKLPLSVLQMISSSLDNTVQKDINYELERLSYSINSTLMMIRSRNLSTDLVMEPVAFREIVVRNIEDLQLFLRSKDLEIEISLNDDPVVTDKKWLHYCLSQLLHNAIKYSNASGMIQIYDGWMDNQGIAKRFIAIQDNGLGIPIEDINRIFTKGYVGKNGRNSNNSSGMGLYITKKICTALGHEIDVTAAENQGSCFRILFNNPAPLHSSQQM